MVGVETNLAEQNRFVRCEDGLHTQMFRFIRFFSSFAHLLRTYPKTYNSNRFMTTVRGNSVIYVEPGRSEFLFSRIKKDRYVF